MNNKFPVLSFVSIVYRIFGFLLLMKYLWAYNGILSITELLYIPEAAVFIACTEISDPVRLYLIFFIPFLAANSSTAQAVE